MKDKPYLSKLEFRYYFDNENSENERDVLEHLCPSTLFESENSDNENSENERDVLEQLCPSTKLESENSDNENSENERDDLEQLCPSTKLESLIIKNYGGKKFPKFPK